MTLQAGFVLVATGMFIIAAWLARASQHNPALRRAYLISWAVILIAFFGYTLVSALSVSDIVASDPALAKEMGLDAQSESRSILAIGLSVAASIGLWFLIFSQRAKVAAARFLPSPIAPEYTTDSRWRDQIRGFNINIPVHSLALGLALLLLVQTLVDFIIAGGQVGLSASGFTQNQVVASAGLTAFMLLSVSIAGSGFRQDRDWQEVLKRLGIRRPSFNELLVGSGLAVTLVSFQFCAGAVWMFLAPEEVFEQQNQLSQAIAGSVTSVYAAFLIALFSSWGEEIAFRGALQPVLGLVPTTLLFALTHIQYQLSPATIIIFIVGLTFGWARRYYGTATAITTHFLYNFTLLLVAILANQVVDLQELEAIIYSFS